MVNFGKPFVCLRLIQLTVYCVYNKNELFIYFFFPLGRWSCPTFSGSRPPPCADFTFTSIDLVRAVLYGGDRGINDDVKEIYIFDFHYLVL